MKKLNYSWEENSIYDIRFVGYNDAGEQVYDVYRLSASNTLTYSQYYVDKAGNRTYSSWIEYV